MNVSACLVTKGDLDLTAILREIDAAGITDVVIWDNALEHDEGVYGRYRAIQQAQHPIVYVQDDDCIVPAATILILAAAHRRGIICNMPARFVPHYPDSCLLGFGAVFERELPARAFARYIARYGAGRERERPDVVFTALTPFRRLDLPVEILPVSSAPERQWRRRGHHRQRERVLRLARRVRPV